MNYRTQKNVTLTEEQQKFATDNYGKMNNVEIAKMLGLSYNKLYFNLRVIGLIKEQAKVINIDTNGYFDVDKFAELYRY